MIKTTEFDELGDEERK